MAARPVKPLPRIRRRQKSPLDPAGGGRTKGFARFKDGLKRLITRRASSGFQAQAAFFYLHARADSGQANALRPADNLLLPGLGVRGEAVVDVDKTHRRQNLLGQVG